jgi:TolA-binding protein
MLPSLRSLFPAVLLLTTSSALAESSVPAAEVPAREIVTRVSSQQAGADEQLRALTREVESLESAVNQLRAKEAERAVHEAELLGQDNHPLWP